LLSPLPLYYNHCLISGCNFLIVRGELTLFGVGAFHV
jgi:hypothetical protein